MPLHGLFGEPPLLWMLLDMAYLTLFGSPVVQIDNLLDDFKLMNLVSWCDQINE